MPSRPGFQVQLALPSGTVRIPFTPVDLPSGAYGIWPVNLVLPGTVLRYSTAQLFKRVETSAGGTYYFFFAIPGVRPEFCFNETARIATVSRGLKVEDTPAGILAGGAVDDDAAGAEISLEQDVHLVLLPESVAESVWRGDSPSLLVQSRAAAFSDGDRWTLESDGNPEIDFGLFGAGQPTPANGIPLTQEPVRGLLQLFHASFPRLDLKPQITRLKSASARAPWQFGPKLSWQPRAIPLAPDDADFDKAAAWRISVPAIPAAPYLSNVLLRIDYQGDVARLSLGKHLIDDNFWNGQPWKVGLKEAEGNWPAATAFDLRILGMPKDYPMFLEDGKTLHFDEAGLADSLQSVRLVPRYRLQFQVNPAGDKP